MRLADERDRRSKEEMKQAQEAILKAKAKRQAEKDAKDKVLAEQMAEKVRSSLHDDSPHHSLGPSHIFLPMDCFDCLMPLPYNCCNALC